MSTDRRDVYFLVNMFPGKLIVDYECPHEGKKAKHHCDYSKPFNIHKLCPKCHGAAHGSRKGRSGKIYLISPRALKLTIPEITRPGDGGRKLEERFGVSFATIKRIMSGSRVSLWTLYRIANALSVAPEEILQ